jgi:tagatose 6-phosphate kinase
VPDDGFLALGLNPVLQRTLVFSAVSPGAVNRTGESRLDASGKGINVARVLTQLGARVTQLTCAGGRLRELFLELAEADGVRVAWVESRSEIRWCTTVLERAEQRTTELVEESPPVAPGTEAAVRAEFARLLSTHGTVTFSGTKAPGFSAAVYPELVAAARAAGKRTIVDVTGPDLVGCLAARPSVAKPNYEEFIATFFPELAATERDTEATEREVRARLGALARSSGAALVLTRGPRPALVAQGAEQWEQPAEPVEPLNTTGSGDAFTAALAHALARGADLREAVAAGHRAGAENARRLRPGVIA